MGLKIIAASVLAAAIIMIPTSSMATKKWEEMDIFEQLDYIDELIVKYKGLEIDIPQRHCAKKNLKQDVEQACEIKMWACLGNAVAVRQQGMLAILGKWQETDETGRQICSRWCRMKFQGPQERIGCREGCNPVCTELGEYKDEVLQLIGDFGDD
jgi:hypothetical protein